MRVIKAETPEERIARLEAANEWLVKSYDDILKLLNASLKCNADFKDLLERSTLQTDRVLGMLKKETFR